MTTVTDGVSGDRGAHGRDAASIKPGSTRARIQEAALDLFVRNGYEKTSLREISDQLGVTKAALYYHFASKQELLQSITQPLLDELESLLAEDRGIADLLDRYVDLLAGNHSVFEIFVTDHAALVAAELSERSMALRRKMIRTVAGTAAADPKPADLIRAAAALGALTQGYLSAARLDPAGTEHVDPADFPELADIKKLIIGAALRVLDGG